MVSLLGEGDKKFPFPSPSRGRLKFGHFISKKNITNSANSLTISIEQSAYHIYWQFQAGCARLIINIKALF